MSTDVDDFFLAKLRALARSLGVDETGTRDELYRRLMERDNEQLQNLASYFSRCELFDMGAFMCRLNAALTRPVLETLFRLYEPDRGECASQQHMLAYIVLHMCGCEKGPSVDFTALKGPSVDFTAFKERLKQLLTKRRALLHKLIPLFDVTETGERVSISSCTELGDAEACEHLAKVMCVDVTFGLFTRFAYQPGRGFAIVLVKNSHARTEFLSNHPKHGEVLHFENNRHVSTDFQLGHERHGEIMFWQDTEHVCTRFVEPHYKAGLICQIRDGVHVQSKYATTHIRHGEVCIFENGSQVRTEFEHPHTRCGEVAHWVNGKHIRSEFLDKHHPRFGLIMFWNESGHHVRTEFSEQHPQSGEIQFFEDAVHVSTEFGPGHRHHGLRVLYKDDHALADPAPEEAAAPSDRPVIHWHDSVAGYQLLDSLPVKTEWIRYFEAEKMTTTLSGHIRRARRDKCNMVVFGWRANDGDDEPSYLYYGETAKTVHLQGGLPAGIERVRVYGSKDVTALTGVAAASKKGKRARRRDRQREVDARAPNVEAEQEEALATSREEAPSHETLDEQFCVICLERERTHALIPCGHRCLCAQCCERLEAAASANCPLCTAPVMQGLRIYG